MDAHINENIIIRLVFSGWLNWYEEDAAEVGAFVSIVVVVVVGIQAKEKYPKEEHRLAEQLSIHNVSNEEEVRIASFFFWTMADAFGILDLF